MTRGDLEEKKRYVLVCTVVRDMLVLIRKIKPNWQNGMLNLPGGKVEPGEDYQVAAVRELREETGLECMGIEEMGSLEGDDYKVVVFNAICAPYAVPETKTAEAVVWGFWSNLRVHPTLIPNLKIVVPLCQAGVPGWTLRDGYGATAHKSVKNFNLEWT